MLEVVTTRAKQIWKWLNRSELEAFQKFVRGETNILVTSGSVTYRPLCDCEKANDAVPDEPDANDSHDRA